MNSSGIGYALAAYGAWGLLPVYWKQLQEVPALEILLHRMVWSLLFLALAVYAVGRWRRLRPALGDRRGLALYAAAALLLSGNWWIYIWAVNAGFIVETSLGYFINPLVAVALGVVVFRERLPAGQWLAIGLATAGVAYLTWAYGRLPWISLALAFSFAFYGVLKKIAPLGALEGLTLETALMSLPALGVLGYWQAAGTASFGARGLGVDLLLVGAGAATALPLFWFGAAAQRLPLSIVGVMQYIAPTIQLLLGVLVYGEPFRSDRRIGFSLIWAALVLFTFVGIRSRRARARAPSG